ncbi:MAG: glycoside hydrolase family 16 protein [Bacteroidaceae bacterium]|nr:glycoside hydrolase family 16 protein [Bacteroidaceae bacterium]
MKKIILLSTILLVSLAVDAQKPKYRLVWKENFNGKELRSDRWSKIPRGRSDWNNFMSFDERCYDFSDGKMTLIGLVNDYLPQDTAPYLTGGIFTKDKFSITYGKVEVKARLQGAQGAWPAIWMLPENASWPDGGEIDIMERLNHEAQAYQTVHSYYTYTLKMKEPDNSATAPIRPDKYNVYAVEILSDSLVFSINGRRTFTYPRIETSHKGQFPFGTPFYLLIDMQIEGQWVGKARPEELPVKMIVDWVKFYELKK